MKKQYLRPEVNAFDMHLEGMLLTGSIVIDDKPVVPAANEYREVEGEKGGNGNLWGQTW